MLFLRKNYVLNTYTLTRSRRRLCGRGYARCLVRVRHLRVLLLSHCYFQVALLEKLASLRVEAALAEGGSARLAFPSGRLLLEACQFSRTFLHCVKAYFSDWIVPNKARICLRVRANPDGFALFGVVFSCDNPRAAYVRQKVLDRNVE